MLFGGPIRMVLHGAEAPKHTFMGRNFFMSTFIALFISWTGTININPSEFYFIVIALVLVDLKEKSH